jgi:hypothetical protein
MFYLPMLQHMTIMPARRVVSTARPRQPQQACLPKAEAARPISFIRHKLARKVVDDLKAGRTPEVRDVNKLRVLQRDCQLGLETQKALRAAGFEFLS